MRKKKLSYERELPAKILNLFIFLIIMLPLQRYVVFLKSTETTL